MDETGIRVDGVTKRYGALEVLRGVDLSVPAGKFAAVIGKSGSGKSTLIGVVSGLEKPDSGRVLVQGHDLSHLDQRQMAELRRLSIGIVFQNFSSISFALRARQCPVADILRRSEPSVRERRARAIELLDQVGLHHRMQHRPSELSGGENSSGSPSRVPWSTGRRSSSRTNRPAISTPRPAPLCSNCYLRWAGHGRRRFWS